MHLYAIAKCFVRHLFPEFHYQCLMKKSIRNIMDMLCNVKYFALLISKIIVHLIFTQRLSFIKFLKP